MDVVEVEGGLFGTDGEEDEEEDGEQDESDEREEEEEAAAARLEGSGGGRRVVVAWRWVGVGMVTVWEVEVGGHLDMGIWMRCFAVIIYGFWKVLEE